MDVFRSTLAAFEESHDQLLNGGGGVQAVIEERADLQKQWDAVDVAWKDFKQQVEGFAQNSAGSEVQTVNKADNLVREIEKAIPLYSQPDPEVPEKPPPFPYTQIIYAIIGTSLFLMIGAISCYFIRKNSRHQQKQQNKGDQWGDVMGGGASNNEAEVGPAAGQPPAAQATTEAVVTESI